MGGSGRVREAMVAAIVSAGLAAALALAVLVFCCLRRRGARPAGVPRKVWFVECGGRAVPGPRNAHGRCLRVDTGTLTTAH